MHLHDTEHVLSNNYDPFKASVHVHVLWILFTTQQILRQVNSGEVVLTQIILSYSGRMLFVGTSSGAVRAVKFPLTDPGEWQEHQVHSAAVSRVRLHDLISVYNIP